MNAVSSDVYMGRMFLLPPHLEKDGQQELWINVGWNTDANRRFPDYVEIMAPVCSREQYNEFMRAVREYMDRNALDADLVTVSLLLCALCFIPVPCLCLLAQQQRFDPGLRELLQHVSKDFPVPVRLERVRINGEIVSVPPPTDQFGELLCYSTGEDRRVLIGWPPLGYNIVMSVPKSYDMRLHWPSATPQAALTAAVLLGGITNSQPPPYSESVSRLSTGERLKVLEELRESAAVTEDEYRVKRANILAEL
jgi:hypothetical protein